MPDDPTQAEREAIQDIVDAARTSVGLAVAVDDLFVAARAAGRAEVEEALRQRAEMYQQEDGSPGPLAPNCWGWQTIARELRALLPSPESSERHAGTR